MYLAVRRRTVQSFVARMTPWVHEVGSNLSFCGVVVESVFDGTFCALEKKWCVVPAFALLVDGSVMKSGAREPIDRLVR